MNYFVAIVDKYGNLSNLLKARAYPSRLNIENGVHHAANVAQPVREVLSVENYFELDDHRVDVAGTSYEVIDSAVVINYFHMNLCSRLIVLHNN